MLACGLSLVSASMQRHHCRFSHLSNVCAKPISMKNGRKSFAQPVAFPIHSVIVSSEVQMLSFKLWLVRAAATP